MKTKTQDDMRWKESDKEERQRERQRSTWDCNRKELWL